MVQLVRIGCAIYACGVWLLVVLSGRPQSSPFPPRRGRTPPATCPCGTCLRLTPPPTVWTPRPPTATSSCAPRPPRSPLWTGFCCPPLLTPTGTSPLVRRLALCCLVVRAWWGLCTAECCVLNPAGRHGRHSWHAFDRDVCPRTPTAACKYLQCGAAGRAGVPLSGVFVRTSSSAGSVRTYCDARQTTLTCLCVCVPCSAVRVRLPGGVHARHPRRRRRARVRAGRAAPAGRPAAVVLCVGKGVRARTYPSPCNTPAPTRRCYCRLRVDCVWTRVGCMHVCSDRPAFVRERYSSCG